MKKFYERYKHAIPLIVYAFIYLSWFSYLERTVQNPQTIIHMKWDDMIVRYLLFHITYGLVTFPLLYCTYYSRINRTITGLVLFFLPE